MLSLKHSCNTFFFFFFSEPESQINAADQQEKVFLSNNRTGEL